MSRINKFATRTTSRVEIGNFLDNFKTNILGSLSEQIDTLKIQNKQKAKNAALSIFSPKCRNRHALRECPIEIVEYVLFVQKVITQKNSLQSLDLKWSWKMKLKQAKMSHFV